MIESVHIVNYLYIRETSLSFSPKCNVLIGESGAGKSILANVLAIPLGVRSTKSVIGPYGDKVFIEIKMTVDLNSGPLEQILASMPELLDVTGTSEWVFKIEIGKKTSFLLNGVKLVAAKMREVFSHLLDIHSQNNYDLLRDNQLHILDQFMTPAQKQTFSSYKIDYDELLKFQHKMSQIESEIYSDSEKEFAQFQIEEIIKINPDLGEDDSLFKQLQSSQKKANQAERLVSLNDRMGRIQKELGVVLNDLTFLEDVDSNFGDIKKKMDLFKIEFDDCSWQVTKQSGQYETLSEKSILDIETRLAELEKLKSRHGKSLSEILDLRVNIESKLSSQDQLKHERDALIKEIDSQTINLWSKAKTISGIRRGIAETIIQEISAVLSQLKLDRTTFRPSFTSLSTLTAMGVDQFEFYVRVNVGGQFSSLDKLSGGESSRILLALKTVLLKVSPVETYLFDEIDSGVSGDISKRMADVMTKMSKHRQLLLITHLPNVAASGDRIFQIKKSFSESDTEFMVTELVDEKARIEGIKLLLSEESDQATNAYAKSLLNY
jgi:DNA repair protein RecN (Recombination protein N)